jgi:hypothetical protein
MNHGMTGTTTPIFSINIFLAELFSLIQKQNEMRKKPRIQLPVQGSGRHINPDYGKLVKLLNLADSLLIEKI